MPLLPWRRAKPALAGGLDPSFEVPTIPPYRRQPSLRERRSRRRKFFSGLIFFAAIYGFLISIFPISWYLYLAFPIVLLALVVIWALPEAEHYPEKTLRRLFFGLFIFYTIWPNYLAIAIPGLPWITMGRLWAAPLCLLLLVSLSISGKFRKAIREPFEATPWLFRLMIALLVLQTVTLPLSDSVGDSFNRYLNAQFQWTTVFFLSAYFFAQPGRATFFLKWLCGLTVVIVVIAVLEHRAQGVLWANHIPPIFQIDDPRVKAILEGARREGVYRVQANFVTSLNLAEYLSFVTPFFIHLAMFARRFAARIAAALFLPLTFWVILLTDARLGVAGFLGSFVCYGLLWSLRYWARNRQNVFAPLFVLAYPAVVIGSIALSFLWPRLNDLVWGDHTTAASDEGRQEQFTAGIEKILEWPIGHGIGQGAITLGYEDQSGMLSIDSHYLMVALEYGIAGFLIYYGVMLVGAWHGVRYGMTADDEDQEALLLLPVSVMLTIFVVLKGVLAQEESHHLIFMGLGMVAALSSRIAQRRAGGHSQ